MHTHVVQAFVKDDVPLPNRFQPLDNVGAPESRVPSSKGRKGFHNDSSVLPEYWAILYHQRLCESQF